jgi:putative ABC transport system permease protein
MFGDIRFAFRTLAKSPGFTLIAVLTLALGIGANTAIFSVINSVLLRPLPYPRSEQLVAISDSNPAKNIEQSKLTPVKYAELVASQKSFSHIAGYEFENLSLPSGDHAESITVAKTVGPIFPLIGVAPFLGRTLNEADDRVGTEPVAVLNYTLWRDQFGSDTQIIGRQIQLSRESYTVVGVMPEGFQFPAQVQVWVPAALDPSLFAEAAPRMARFLNVFGRLKDGVMLNQAQAELATAAAQIAQHYPRSDGGWTVKVDTLYEQTIGHARAGLLILAGAVALVLLIACVNVANLQLTRAESRHQEMAVRAALGANRAQLVRQLLVESLILALAGGILGTLVALWGIDLLAALNSGQIPRVRELRPDASVFGFALVLATLTGIFSGLAPALNSSRINLDPVLRESAHAVSGSVRSHRVRGILLVAQIAFALVLLTSSALLIKSLFRLQRVDPGFTRANILTFRLSLPWERRDESVEFYKRVLQRIGELPGIQSVGASSFLPVSASDAPLAFHIEGESRGADDRLLADFSVVSSGYFPALGIPLKKGRIYTEADSRQATPAVIVNESFVRRFLPNQDPVGKLLRFEGRFGSPKGNQIIGVVGSVRRHGLEQEPGPEVYLSYQQTPWPYMSLVARTKAAPASVAQSIQRALYAVDSTQPVFDIKTMEERLDDSVAQRRFNMLLLGLFAALALILASIGIYGVISYSVTQRTREIGLRLALGAQRSDVLRLIIAQGLRLTVIGLAAGVAVALAIGKLISSLLYGINAHDPLTFLTTGLVLSAVALLACWLPARRASRLDPLIALRQL